MQESPEAQQADNAARTHLEKLAEELRQRAWQVRVANSCSYVVLHVINPAAPSMVERITCDEGPRGLRFFWSWREVIGPVERVKEVADRIAKVLAA